MILFVRTLNDFLHTVVPMNDEYFKILALMVVAILVISLTINGFLASNPHSFSTPPVRVGGYFTQEGTPIPGYYLAPGQVPQSPMIGEPCKTCK
jgi:hypothetical protein